MRKRAHRKSKARGRTIDANLLGLRDHHVAIHEDTRHALAYTFENGCTCKKLAGVSPMGYKIAAHLGGKLRCSSNVPIVMFGTKCL